MSQNQQKNRNTTVLLLSASIIATMVSLLANVVSSYLPDFVKSHPLFTWLLFIILTAVSIALTIRLHRLGQEATSSAQSSVSSVSPTAGTFRQMSQPTMRRPPSDLYYSTGVLFDVPATTPDPINTTLPPPLSWDDDDDNEDQVIDEPPAQKLQKVPEISVQAKILSLQPLKAQSVTVKKLLEQPKMLCWLPQGDSLACIFYEKVSLFNLNEKRLVNLPFSGLVDAVCLSLDGSIIAISSEGKIHFWSTAALEEDTQLQTLYTHTKHIYGLDWSREKLAIWEGTDIRLFMFSKDEIYQSLSTKEQALTCNKPGLLRWSPDGSWLAAGAANGMLICWHVDTKRQRLLSSDPLWRPYSLTWLPGSLILAVASVHKRSGNKRITMWDMREDQPIASWEELPVLPLTLSASTQQQLVIASREQQLLFGSPNDDTPTARYPGQLLAAWSPTQSQLATLDPQDPTTLVLLSDLSESNAD